MTISQVCHVRLEKKSIKDPDDVELTAELEMDLSSIEEKEGKSSGFKSDKDFTNLLVDELIIIKKYINFYYN